MSKPKTGKQSGLSIFAAFVIAIGLFVAFIKSDIEIAAISVGAGVFLIILSLFLDRLDTIIDLLRQVIDRDNSETPGED